MSRGSRPDLIEIVPQREDILRHIDETPRRKCELVEQIDVSRSTIDRSIRELENASLIEGTHEGYRRTICGRIALQEYDRMERSLDSLADCEQVLLGLDPDARLDNDMLVGSDVFVSKRSTPEKPLERLYELVERAEFVRGFTPSIHPQQVSVYHSRIVDAGLEASIVLTPDVVERLLSTYDDRLEEALETGNIEIREIDSSLPYSLTIAETAEGTAAGLMVYVEDGVRGFIRNDAEDAIDWATDTFREYYERSEPLF